MRLHTAWQAHRQSGAAGPETGEGVFNKGFSSWNALVANMIAYLENKEVIEEWSCP